MTKRRRVDDGSSGDSSGAEAGFAEWDHAPTQHVPQTFNGGGYAPDSTTHDQVAAHGFSSEGAQPAMNWSSGLSPYPDVSSYQQPYFYQQTDPSIYTSPWPPVQDVVSAFGTPTGGYQQVVPVSNSMPFFPAPQTHVQTEQADGYDAGHTVYEGFPELEPDLRYDYEATQARSERTRPANAFYFEEDASMHLKMQSLPILDNLVSAVQRTSCGLKTKVLTRYRPLSSSIPSPRLALRTYKS